MARVFVTRDDFLRDSQGRLFADVVNDPQQPFDTVLNFFNNDERQRRMVDAEVRCNRAPFAVVEQELEAQPAIRDFLASNDESRRKRLGQAVTVVVRMIMVRLGWQVIPQTVGKK